MQGRRKLFHGVGDGTLSKNVDHHGWPTAKDTLNQSPIKRNLDQNIYDSRISYLEFFFWKYYFGHKKFLYLSRSSSGYHQSLFFFDFRFSSRKSQSQQRLAKKITHFTVQFCSKSLTHYTSLNSLGNENNMLLQHGQKPFWVFSKHISVWCQKQYLYCTISWRPRTAFLTQIESNCLYISIYLLRTFLFQRLSKILSGKEWDGGRLNNFLKAVGCLGLAKYFTNFHFNW